MSVPSMAQVFAQLHARGFVADAEPPALAPLPAGTPWFVRVMAGFGAWLGGIFLLGALMALFSMALRSGGGMMVLGMLLIGGAFALYRAAKGSEALQQLGLACSMAGQFALAFGMDEALHLSNAQTAGMLVLLQAFLVVVMDGALHRYLSTLFAAAAGFYFLDHIHAVPLGGAVLAVAVTWIWLTESRWTAAGRAPWLRPVGYALALALLFWQAPFSLDFWRWGHRDVPAFVLPYWIAPLAYGLCLAVTAAMLAREHAPRAWPRWMAAALVVSGVAWLAPGLIAALLVLLLGANRGSRILCGLALLAAAWYLGAYYYQMQITLLAKSGVMVASGALLIVLRFLMSWLWKEPVRV